MTIPSDFCPLSQVFEISDNISFYFNPGKSSIRKWLNHSLKVASIEFTVGVLHHRLSMIGVFMAC